MTGFISKIRSWLIPTKKRVSLWEQHHSIEEYRKALELRIIMRAQRDENSGNIEKAIKRYEGFFQGYSVNQQIHNKLAQLYYQVNDFKRAGRHLYLKENPSSIEKECVIEFEKSCGKSPTIILKKIIYKENYRIKELDEYSKLKLKRLINEASIESGVTPNFLNGIKRFLDKIKVDND